MLRERVSTDIYVFTSDLYVQVTSGVIMTPEGAVVIDTLPFPVESREIARFVAQHSAPGARYLILTHHHADHTYGAYLFPRAQVLMHERCRQLLQSRGEEGLAAARAEAPELEEVVLPSADLTLDEGELIVHVGNKILRLFPMPGHSEDMLAIFIEEERILFAGDTVMPVPTIADGDIAALRQSLHTVLELQPECIVQGHGEVILRGEVQDVIRANLKYLDVIQQLVAEAIARGKPKEALLNVGIEKCGLSRVALNGRAPELHAVNLLTLYRRMQSDGG